MALRFYKQKYKYKGSGNGDLIIHNAGGEIKLDSQGNVDITATNVLTLNGTFITFGGSIDYDITSPQAAWAPSNASPARVSIKVLELKLKVVGQTLI